MKKIQYSLAQPGADDGEYLIADTRTGLIGLFGHYPHSVAFDELIAFFNKILARVLRCGILRIIAVVRTTRYFNDSGGTDFIFFILQISLIFVSETEFTAGNI